jgi:enoyl-CoA hydratase/carnithine racemase
MSEAKETFITDKSAPGHWRVTLNNPPINVIDDQMYDAFYDLVAEIETEPTLKLGLDVRFASRVEKRRSSANPRSAPV